MDRQRHTFRQGYSPSGPKPKPRRAKRGVALTAVFVIVVLGSLAAKSLLPSLQAKAHGAGLPALKLVKKPAPVNQTLMASQINGIIGSSSLEVGVSIIDLTDNQRYDYGLGDTEYIAASTTKLLSASLFLHDVEQGQDSLGQSLDDTTAQAEMQKMIVVSDDDAWVAFNDLLGHRALLQYAQSLGMNSYDPDNNTITSDDLALLLGRLYQGKLLNSQHTNLLLGYMAQADYTQYIGSAIPQGTKFYHKVGYLDDRVMDAAIIDNGKHPYVLVIFTKDPSGVSYDQTAGQQAFHDITAATLSVFTH
ncbi:MAG TPA: serine hydrolase [Candidatus Saccharimonadales bacterium]